MFASIGLCLTTLLALLSEHRVAATDDCPGVIEGNAPSTTCCVGGQLTVSVCDGWPICKGPTTVTQTEISCATILYASDSDYSSLVSAASVSLTASGTHYQTAIPRAPAATGAGSGGSAASQTQTAASTAAVTSAAATTPASTSASASGNGVAGSQEGLKWVAGAAGALVAVAAVVAL